MKILAIIPAKTDSTRLPKKNIQKIKGKTLVEYSIDYAKQSKYNPKIIVSSEDEVVWNIAIKNQIHKLQIFLKTKLIKGKYEFSYMGHRKLKCKYRFWQHN